MGLSLDDFASRGVPGNPCGVSLLLAELGPEDRAVLEAAMADPNVQHAAIERVLKREGIVVNGRPVKALTVSRHRRGACSCGS